MTPAPGDRRLRFVGDWIRFRITDREGRAPLAGWRALLRTNVGRAARLRDEIVQAHTRGLPLAGSSWRDIPMRQEADGWSLELPLSEPGFFKAKGYLVDTRGWQHWPEGPDVGISVHPDRYRTANVLYCAFARMFGQGKARQSSRSEKLERALAPLDQKGYTVIPPSGTLRDLTEQLPHIIGTLGCRILQLLPVNPTPTTYARFGRYGSPYAALDLTAIDPALVVFDKRSTGVDQFRELAYETHARGARLFLDIVINHTGWGSRLQEQHPEWFLRDADGAFVSPGAWGTVWEDLVELKHQNVALWDELAEVFLTWCRRGVDGFRCDAGYKVPVAAWQYIVARVQQEYPETLFLLEGLGGAWEATEALLTEGGMQWAYSELFQNYSGAHVAGYLDHSLKQSQRVGLLLHYSETHDNERLAARGRAWSLLRNRLCALASTNASFGFTCGVEWLATEKIRVHGSSGMAWGNPENLIPELARLNRLLKEHPAFFDGAQLTRLSPSDAPVFALQRQSAETGEVLLVLVNTDVEESNVIALEERALSVTGRAARCANASPPSTTSAPPERTEPEKGGLADWVDLLGQAPPVVKRMAGGRFKFTLPPGAAYCLAPALAAAPESGPDYRRARAQAAWALAALSRVLPVEHVGPIPWRTLAAAVESSPEDFLTNICLLRERMEADSGATSRAPTPGDLESELARRGSFPHVVPWTPPDVRRITLVPPGHWLLVRDSRPFRAKLAFNGPREPEVENVESIEAGGAHIACFSPRQAPGDATLRLERYAERDQYLEGAVRFPGAAPVPGTHPARNGDLVLLTNGRGAMARIRVDLGRVLSKYDCVLGANLHPTLPVDRHIFAKRIRAWVNADGFISPLDFQNLEHFEPGPPAQWKFVANAGDGHTVEIEITAVMLEGRNTTVFCFARPTAADATGKQLPGHSDVRLTVRLDIEDRNFHWETRRNGGAEYHFSSHTRPLPAADAPAENVQGAGGPEATADGFAGFLFTPAADRRLLVAADSGRFHLQPEWSENIPHPIEQSRGQVGSGDGFSPGWFELPLPKGAEVRLLLTAEPAVSAVDELARARAEAQPAGTAPVPGLGAPDEFERQLRRAVRAFVVARESGKTVIAGYPWFLDWGRDTFICARGLLAAGLTEEVRQILNTFARFEKDGTLPNTLFGDNASNRDTSDAPLWFGLAHEELAAAVGPSESVLAALESIGRNYARGTPNGIRMDPASALIWSPSHFTWMDTNFPAGTPRQGYPVEIQALWIRLLRQLAAIGRAEDQDYWTGLANRALESLQRLFWREESGYYADVLLARPGLAPAEAVVDDALRSNCLLVASLGLASGERARGCVEAARQFLLVPGGVRSLAPVPVSVPLPIYSAEGRLLNRPEEPYWGRYEGDEDTRRKPAYHNGTAWTWTLPVFCEALARAWEFSPAACAAARSYLGSLGSLLAQGCLGHIPEILDGDAPHTPRGCDAQAWSATEALRVWRLLRERSPQEA